MLLQYSPYCTMNQLQEQFKILAERSTWESKPSSGMRLILYELKLQKQLVKVKREIVELKKRHDEDYFDVVENDVTEEESTELNFSRSEGKRVKPIKAWKGVLCTPFHALIGFTLLHFCQLW